MRVEALEPAGAGSGARDSEVELGPERALLGMRARKAARELGILRDGAGPAFHPACRLDARHRRDEVRTGQPEAGGERAPVLVVGLLLGDCRAAEGAADGDATKGARAATELALHDRDVIHHLPAYGGRAARRRFP